MLEHLNKDFVTDFANCATVFRAIFPSEEERLTEIAKKLFDELVLLRSSLVRKFLEVVEWSSRNWCIWRTVQHRVVAYPLELILLLVKGFGVFWFILQGREIQ